MACLRAVSQLVLATRTRLDNRDYLIAAMKTTMLCENFLKARVQKAHSRGDVACLLAIGQLTLASRACLDHKLLLIVAVLTDYLNYLHIRRGSVMSALWLAGHQCQGHAAIWQQTAVDFTEPEEKLCV